MRARHCDCEACERLDEERRLALIAAPPAGPALGEELLRIDVSGMPQTKGSWRPISRGGRTRLIPDNDGEPAWSAAVGWAARAAQRGRQPTAGPVAVEVLFRLPVPPNRRRTLRRDLDKLARSVLDAMQGIVYVDDEQVQGLDMRKITTTDAGQIGALIVVRACALS